jgi:hypothetical protein
MMRSKEGPRMNDNSSLAGAGDWLLEILLLPGNAFVYLLVNYASPVADLFALRTDETGTVTITASVVIWLAAIVLTGTLLTKIRDIDRSITAWIVAGFNDIRRHIRVFKRRITSTLALRFRRNSNKDDDLVLSSVQLANIETSVLRCLSRIDDGAIMTTQEMAAALARPERELRKVLQRLVELGLIEHRSDRWTSNDGHCIATAGQMYLLGA